VWNENTCMPDILKPEKNSTENIFIFLETIEDEELRELIRNNLDAILAVGSNQDSERSGRNTFFEAISNLIGKRVGNQDAD